MWSSYPSTLRRSKRLLVISASILLAALLSANLSVAQNSLFGQSIVDIIEEFRQDGWAFVYSTNLVSTDLRVTVNTDATDPVEIVREVLAPYELTVTQQNGVYLITRAATDANNAAIAVDVRRLGPTGFSRISLRLTGPERRTISTNDGSVVFDDLPAGDYQLSAAALLHDTVTEAVELLPNTTVELNIQLLAAAPLLEQVTVSASRYDITDDGQYSASFFGRTEIENLSDLGGDPLRVVHRLPGTASGDYSAKSHVRGGNKDEMSIVLDGLELIDPFHTRDFQSLFSSINQRAVSSIQVYSGGFPASYGGSLSGLMLIEPRSAENETVHEIGLSLFSTSVLSSGTFRDGSADWLAAIRRGNLDLLLDRSIGKPSYNDAYIHLGFDAGPRTYVSINGLASEDDISLISEDDGADQENASSDTSNQQLWLKIENQWTDILSSRTVISSAHFSNIRAGIVVDPLEIDGRVTDHRALNVFGLRQDWEFDLTDQQLLTWGTEVRRMRTDYNYSSALDLFGFFAEFQGALPSTQRDINISPSGDSYALYFVDKISITERLVADFGIRWDKQTYLPAAASDDQLSPRFGILYRVGPHTDLRASWGRFHQAHDILGLQVEDGVETFFPAQLAANSIISIEHRFSEDLTFRVEAYRRAIKHLQPRYENLFETFALLPELQPDRTLVDPEQATAKGIEILISKDGGNSLNWWASYTHSRVDDRIAGRDIPRSWDQRQSLSGGFTWHREQWTVTPSANYHTGWPVTSLTRNAVSGPGGPAEFEVVPGERNSERVGDFAKIDLRAARLFDAGDGLLEAFVEISNVFDRDNPCCIDYDLETAGDGSQFLERSERFWMPRVVSVGVLWEF